MYMEESPDMSKVKEPRAIVGCTYLRNDIHGRFWYMACTNLGICFTFGPDTYPDNFSYVFDP